MANNSGVVFSLLFSIFMNHWELIRIKNAGLKCMQVVREPAILLIKWLRPKGLKVCSYEEKYAEFKIKLLKKLAGTQKCYAKRNTPGVGNFSN